MYIKPIIPFIELYNEEVIGQEQTDVCISTLIRDLTLMKNGNKCKCPLIEYYINTLIASMYDNIEIKVVW